MSVGEQQSLTLTSLANKFLHSKHTHCVWQVISVYSRTSRTCKTRRVALH